MKTLNNWAITVFSAIGTFSLCGVIFWKEYHQLLIVAMCAVLVAACICENIKIKKNDDN
jgi:uncharacterized membrane protein